MFFRFADVCHTSRSPFAAPARSVDVVFSENAVICNLHTPTGALRGKDPELHFQILKDSNYSVANIGITANLW